MKHRLSFFAVCTIITATTASAQWINCTGGSATCTTQSVGAGTTSPQRNFVISGPGTATFQLSTRGTSATCCDGFQFQQVGANSHLINEEAGGAMAFWTQANQRMTIDAAGKVGIGTTTPAFNLDVVGSINASGNITGLNVAATYQDVAEWVPSDDVLKPGMVVVIAPDSNNHVDASTEKYATSVAGVVSEKPGITLGVASRDKSTIATTGRVKVLATAKNGAIHRGDLLVTSDIPGTAMRSEPITINGHTFHQPGTIIGKALEPLDQGTGEILVLLSLQ